MTHHAAALEPLRVQPAVREGEVLAAVVVFAVINAHDLLALSNEDGFGAAVAHACQQFGGGWWCRMNDRCRAAAPARPAPRRAPPGCRCREDLDRVRAVMRVALGAGGGKGMQAVAAGRPVCARKYRPPRPFLRCKGWNAGQRVFIVPRHAGMTSVPFGPGGSLGAAISPAGPPSTSLTFEKAQWTSSTPPRLHAQGVELGDQLGGETGWAGMRNHIQPPPESE